MNALEFAEKTLLELTEKIGIEVRIEREGESTLQMHSEQNPILIGKEGDRLDDFQYLINRMVIEHFPEAPRIRVDCDHFREGYERKLTEEARDLAEQVRQTGRKASLRPLNSYYRKLAYDALSEQHGITASSPSKKQRYKRILIEPTS